MHSMQIRCSPLSIRKPLYLPSEPTQNPFWKPYQESNTWSKSHYYYIKTSHLPKIEDSLVVTIQVEGRNICWCFFYRSKYKPTNQAHHYCSPPSRMPPYTCIIVFSLLTSLSPLIRASLNPTLPHQQPNPEAVFKKCRGKHNTSSTLCTNYSISHKSPSGFCLILHFS